MAALWGWLVAVAGLTAGGWVRGRDAYMCEHAKEAEGSADLVSHQALRGGEGGHRPTPHHPACHKSYLSAKYFIGFPPPVIY